MSEAVFNRSAFDITWHYLQQESRPSMPFYQGESNWIELNKSKSFLSCGKMHLCAAMTQQVN